MKNTTLFLIFTYCSFQISAQTFASRQSESTMTIAGTSTLHDWESEVTVFKASCALSGDKLEKASLVATVESIKSGTSSMDDNTYEALKEDKFPEITFESTEIKMDGNKATARGTLTIAGQSKIITLPISAEKWTGNHLTVTGSYKFKMSSFGIDPPRAMLGTIRTGDEVTIKFKINLYN